MAISRYDLRRRVNLRGLKDFTISSPKNSHLRDLIIAVNNELDVDEFFAKMILWLKLIRMEFS